MTFISNWVPLQEPAGGPNFFSFDDNAVYQIIVDNVGDAKDHIVYQFWFTTHVRNGNTFLYNTGVVTSPSDPDLNIYQTYTVKAKVSEVVGISAPARTALALSCSEQTLGTVGNNTAANNSLGLPVNTAITSTYTTSVTATGVNASTATVVIVVKPIGSSVVTGTSDGITYTGTCSDAGTTWDIAGTSGTGVATKYLPKK